MGSFSLDWLKAFGLPGALLAFAGYLAIERYDNWVVLGAVGCAAVLAVVAYQQESGRLRENEVQERERDHQKFVGKMMDDSHEQERRFMDFLQIHGNRMGDIAKHMADEGTTLDTIAKQLVGQALLLERLTVALERMTKDTDVQAETLTGLAERQVEQSKLLAGLARPVKAARRKRVAGGK